MPLRLRPRAATLLAAALATACTPAVERWQPVVPARSTAGARSMVVSGSPIASAVGRDILRAGGNAVDAAVAAAFALAVVHQEAGNIGGGGVAVVRLADGTLRALDFRETAPAGASRDMYLDSLGRPTEESQLGHRAAGVPGSVHGLWTLHAAHGRLPWQRVVEPAVALAREGYVLDAYRVKTFNADRQRLTRFEGTRALYFPTGDTLTVGSRLVQPDLAAALERIREQGAEGFYRGRTADLIVEEMRAGGGLITHEDLATYRARWRDPIRTRYRGRTVVTMPPVSAGGLVLLQLLNVMGRDATLPPFGSVALLHREAEAMRWIGIDRSRETGDPDFLRVPVERLLSDTHAAAIAARIGPRATPTPSPGAALGVKESTTHLSVVDAEGNAVSLTTTLNDNFGSAVVVRGAGFLLNNEMDDFAVKPGLPNLYGLVQGENNAIAPGRRMASSMTPTIVLDSLGALEMVLGTPGGSRIPTMVYHILSNLLDHRMPPAEAIAAPRAHHQAWPDSLQLEDGFPRAVQDSLRALGHAIKPLTPRGDVQAIVRVPAGWLGVSDGRRGGAGAGE